MFEGEYKTINEFRREETPRARKDHACDLCHEKIQKCERYTHMVWSESGDVFDDKYHTGCWDLVCRYLETLDYDDYYNSADVIDSMREQVCCDCVHKPDCNLKYRHIPTCPRVVERFLR